MKRSSRLVISCSIICIILGISSLAFSFAWYAMFPTFTNLSFKTLDQSLRIEQQVYLREINQSTGKPGYGYLTFDDANQAQYINYNIKQEDVYHENTVNGVTLHGAIDITFNGLNYKLFDLNSLNLLDENGNVQSNFFDPKTLSFNLDYFTFALFQIKYFADANENYAKVKYKLDLKLKTMTGSNINDSYFMDNYANQLFKIHIINDFVGVEDDVNPLSSSAYEKDGLRQDMLNNPNTVSVGTYQYENLKELNNMYGIGDNLEINSNAQYNVISINTEYPLYPDTQTFAETPTLDANQISIAYNPNNSEDNNIYYAHATALSLGFNPKVMMEFLLDNHYSNTNRPILAPTLSFYFEASNVAFMEESL